MKLFKKIMPLCYATMMLLTGTWGCSSDDGSQTATPDTDNVIRMEPVTLNTAQILAHANTTNTFAFRLLQALQQAKGSEKSLAVSPVSLAFALGMTADSATQKVSDEITTLLGFDGDRDELNNFCKTLLDKSKTTNTDISLYFANAAFFHVGYVPTEQFKRLADTFYEAETTMLDFNSDTGFDQVNEWVSRKTESMIPQLFEKPYPKGLVASVLTNALYFKSGWSSPFDPERTYGQDFTKSDGSVVSLPFMHHNDTVPYLETESYQALRLDYGKGEFSMTFLLPVGESTMSDLLGELNAESWSRIDAALRGAVNDRQNGENLPTVSISMPRFKAGDNYELKDILRQMGLTSAFQSGSLPYLTGDQNLFVTDVLHNTCLEIDEEGTVGSAVSAVVVGRGAKQIRFTANHPFLYIISESGTGCIYFLGSYVGT